MWRIFNKCIVLALLFLACLFTNCSKPKDLPPDKSDQEEEETDQSGIIFTLAESLFSDNKISLLKNSCDIVSVDSTREGVFVIYYDSLMCNKKVRTKGSIVIALINGRRWTDVNAVMEIEYKNFKSSKVDTNLYWIQNGKVQMKNISGGSASSLADGQSIIYGVREMDMKLAFEDGTERSWNGKKIHIIQKQGNNFILSVKGDTVMDGLSNVGVWGTNRKREAFTISTPIPMEFNSCDGDWTVIRGSKMDKSRLKSATYTYGLDKNGSPLPVCNAYGYRLLVEFSNGKKKEVLRAY